MNESMKKATAYQREGRLFLHSLSKTTAGVWILSGPVLVCTSIDNLRLGQDILLMLNASSEQLDHPASWKGLFDPVLQQAGVNTMKNFMKGCKCVEVGCDLGGVLFFPTKNLGLSGGFESIGEKIGPVPLIDPSSIGEGLKTAMMLAE